MLNENIKRIRKSKGLSQEELAIKLNVVRQTVSKWENGCSVPDSSMLISLADELDTRVSILLGENVSESRADDLKLISEKLEMINSKLAKKSIMKLRMLRGGLITLCILIVITFIVLTVMHICGNKTRLRVRTDTELINFPLYCPKCKQETLVNVKKSKLSVIRMADLISKEDNEL